MIDRRQNSGGFRGGFEGFDQTPLLDGPSTKQVLVIG